MNPYPNNPYRNPIKKSKEQENKEKVLKTKMSIERPILEWVRDYIDKELYNCDSIDSLNLDLKNPETVITQIGSLKMLKNHLNRIKGEVEKRMQKTED